MHGAMPQRRGRKWICHQIICRASRSLYSPREARACRSKPPRRNRANVGHQVVSQGGPTSQKVAVVASRHDGRRGAEPELVRKRQEQKKACMQRTSFFRRRAKYKRAGDPTARATRAWLAEQALLCRTSHGIEMQNTCAAEGPADLVTFRDRGAYNKPQSRRFSWMMMSNALH